MTAETLKFSSRSTRKNLEDISISLEYGFIVDRTLIAMELRQAGKALPNWLVNALPNCKKFLSCLAELAKEDTLSAMMRNKRVFAVLSSGDIHEALGIQRGEQDVLTSKIPEFVETIKNIESLGQVAPEKVESVYQFLDRLGSLLLTRTQRLFPEPVD